ncbi:MAG: preprotein translocase subunit YajC [Actinomycetota bacterium]
MTLSLLLQNAATSEQNSGGSFLFTLVFMGLIGAAMYFLMIRPQRRRMRETADLQKSISVGDEVITTSGMYGFVTDIDGEQVWLEVNDQPQVIEIRFSRAAIARKIAPSEAAGDSSPEASGN